MKALHFNSHGGLDKLQYGIIETPFPKPGEVLVKVRASALNHLDLWVLEGWPGLKLEMPHVGGADIAGEVIECGHGVVNWKIGARVLVSPGYLEDGAEDQWTKAGEDSLSPRYHIFGEGRRGGLAEYVTVPEQCLLEIPKEIEFSQAAAPALVGVTAWRMLKTRAQLKAGQTCLIVGAGGGLNSFALQLAKLIGANVIALTSSEEKMVRAKALGADHVINYYKQGDWSRIVRDITDGHGVDVVVDNVGEKTYPQSILSCKRGGCIVTVGNTSGTQVSFDNRLIFTKQISILGSTMGSSKDFKEAMNAVWSNKLKPVIDREMSLREGKEAYELLEKGAQFGKIVLVP
jgi:NADPH:quinone reductase-like Zn-dependent oxidoreductase